MVDPIPTGSENYIPHLIVDGAADAIAFYEKAFGAREVHRSPAPDGRLMHAELEIDGRPFYLADDFPEFTGGAARTPSALGGSPLTVHRFVADCDAALGKAVAAGGTITFPPTDMFWGDRYGKVQDPYGHEWSFATHLKDVSPEEMAAAAEQLFSGGP